jgi:UDP-glucose 4-epimerase
MVYGENNKGNMLPLLKAASKKIPLPLSAAKGKRSMIYVGNILSAILKIIQDNSSLRKPIQTYFLNDGFDLTSAELYSSIYQSMHGKPGLFYVPEFLFRLMGKMGPGLEFLIKRKFPISSDVISRLFDEYRFSSKAFTNEYNWQPPYTPKQGIEKMVNWYLKKESTEN